MTSYKRATASRHRADQFLMRPQLPRPYAAVLLAALLLMPLASLSAESPSSPQPLVLAQAGAEDRDEVRAAEAAAGVVIRAAEEEAARIRSEALRKAAEIEANALRKGAEIEAEAIRRAARQESAASRAQTAPPASFAPAAVAAPRDRYPSIAGLWQWEGNARNRKFDVEVDEDGTVHTDLFISPRKRHYREDLRYDNGVLHGRTHLILKTATGNDTKRFRDFEMEISTDGGRLVGTIIEWEEKGRKEDRQDVIWKRLRD